MTLLLPSGPYAGVNVSLLRRAAAKLADMQSANLYDLAVVLGVSIGEAKPTWDQLLAEGFIELTAGGARPTTRMDALAQARSGKPLPRNKADGLIDKAVAAARKLNALPSDAPYFWVTSLAVFGSYLDADKSELGDLDLAWEVKERPGLIGHITTALMNGRNPMQSTRAQICPKGPYVRMTSMGRMLDLNCAYRIVYTFDTADLV